MTPLAVVRLFLLSLAVQTVCLPASALAAMPSFALNNTAEPGLRIPALGVGTG